MFPPNNSQKVTWANARGDDRKLQVSSWWRLSPWLTGVAPNPPIYSSFSRGEPVWMKPPESFPCISADQWGGGEIKDGKTENAGNRSGFIIPLMAFIMPETYYFQSTLLFGVYLSRGWRSWNSSHQSVQSTNEVRKMMVWWRLMGPTAVG